jgi:Uma2 family endonuclease
MVVPLYQDVEYPESDGKPLGETDAHIQDLIEVRHALKQFFKGQEDVFVGADMFLYYEEGNSGAAICPDAFVARGVRLRGLRRVYKLWEEGAAPCAVFEITSRDTRSNDLVVKKERYAGLGVEEYFLHDPLGEYLRPQLQGFRLRDGRYHPITPAPDGTLESLTLGLRLRSEGVWLRLIDGATGKPLLRSEEEAEAREMAELEIRRLREELERLRSRGESTE